MELLRQQLIAYRPWNEQEERDREELLRRLDSHEDLYTRANTAAHFTASAWVVSPDRKQVLMAYHRLYDSWAWLGGHADGDRDLLAVALREVPSPTRTAGWAGSLRRTLWPPPASRGSRSGSTRS